MTTTPCSGGTLAVNAPDRGRKRGAWLIAGVLLAGAAMATAGNLTAAFSNNRTISLYNIHNKETLTIQYKKDGRYVPEAMEKVNWILRDWRRNEATTMDPLTIDILWEMHTELGSKEPIHVISGFRSRTTNDMLRRTVGGQASESQHTTGKAVDVTFPDVPLKSIRYAAMVRELGGVGYYPTSGIPFVHVDTGRVRAWPRLPRYELALLFPNGLTKHAPADGGALSPEDVKVAQSRYKDLAVQVAEFFDLRRKPKGDGGIVVADAGRTAPAGPPPAPVATTRPAGIQVASLAPALPPVSREPITATEPVVPQPAAALTPKLVAEPKLVERPSRLVPRPTDADRKSLNTLIELAAASSDIPPPRLIRGPAPAVRPGSAVAKPTDAASLAPVTMASAAPSNPTPPAKGTLADGLAAVLASEGKARTSWMQLAALGPEGSQTGNGRSMSDALPPGWGNGYAAAPAFDEEHPEELHYRPFPIAPLLTATASINEPAIARMVAPDVVKVLDLIDQPSAVPPMRFLPGRQTAETMWAQQFKGQPVEMTDSSFGDGAEELPTKLIPRGVKTTPER
ncbi:MAG: DUF882 domain-containing protein [Hyphomicrobiaceae bacterium]|nr:DUF882 domain-containing protein [Hyphomicrobiaceae bacterium]